MSLERLACARETWPGVKWDVGDAITDLPTLYSDKSFDAVILFDVLEHFVKANSWKVLEQAERIARKYVVVWGPLGQDGMDRYNKERQNIDGMYHQCVMEEKEFADRNFFTIIFPSYWERSYDVDWTATAMLAFKKVGE